MKLWNRPALLGPIRSRRRTSTHCASCTMPFLDGIAGSPDGQLILCVACAIRDDLGLLPMTATPDSLGRASPTAQVPWVPGAPRDRLSAPLPGRASAWP